MNSGIASTTLLETARFSMLNAFATIATMSVTFSAAQTKGVEVKIKLVSYLHRNFMSFSG